MKIIGTDGKYFGFTSDDEDLLRKIGKHLIDHDVEKCSVRLPHWEQGYGAYWYYGDWYMEN